MLQGNFSTTVGFVGAEGYSFTPDQAAVLAALQQETIAAAADVAGACPRLAESDAFAALYPEPPAVLGVRSIIGMSPDLAAAQVHLTTA